ncbi:methylglyoxal synthase [Succinispira mobilis]|uniref:methylglyoxal synthase n=1 Tax=Succinispira mobilis TaxID=78120 RepID=UPI00036C6406|nr:methylglyoxal synthase [Succinispira mobilis]
MKAIALIAHDRMKEKMLDFVKTNQGILKDYQLIATATTGKLIKDNTALEVHCFLSGPIGGDMQIGAQIASEQVSMVVFLRDPLTAQPHEPDITALLRVCDVHNIPVATNLAGANIFLQALVK